MRVRKISVLALATAAAGLSLAACNNDTTSGASTSPDSSASAPAGSTQTPSGGDSTTSASGQGGTSATKGATGASNGSGTADGAACRTSHLSFTSSHGMAEGELLINLTNTGAGTCTMHGFPGVDLKGKDGTVSATRSKVAAPDVTLRSGQQTRFTLHFPPNNSGGSGVTFTSLVVTPPNETRSHTMSLSVNIPAGSDSAPTISVDPVGAGK